jgi:HPt (histidine-containing phosphotransfer) domain-containing protein
MNNKKLYARLLNKFKNENTLDAVFNALQSGNQEQAQIAIHTIKGIAANLSLIALYEQSKSLEVEIKAQAVQPESLETIKVCFAETLNSINKVLASYA